MLFINAGIYLNSLSHIDAENRRTPSSGRSTIKGEK